MWSVHDYVALGYFVLIFIGVIGTWWNFDEGPPRYLPGFMCCMFLPLVGICCQQAEINQHAEAARRHERFVRGEPEPERRSSSSSGMRPIIILPRR